MAENIMQEPGKHVVKLEIQKKKIKDFEFRKDKTPVKSKLSSNSSKIMYL